MDLDKAKDIWKKSSSEPSINKEEIENIINNDGVSAFIKMKRYILRGGIFCLIYSLLLIIIIPLQFEHKSKFIPLLTVCFGILIIGGVWSLYCYNYLKKIDLGKMNITDFSHYFLKFCKWEKWEWLGKIFFIILIISTTVYTFINEYTPVFLIVYLLSIFIGVGIGLYIYRQYYRKNLKKVENALNEVEELRKSELQ